MRRTVLQLATFAVWFALPGLAQTAQPHSDGSLLTRIIPHVHSRTTPATDQQDTEGTLDASNLGSPLVLDKGWRVGVTANTAAANRDFDDSAWAVRDARLLGVAMYNAGLNRPCGVPLVPSAPPAPAVRAKIRANGLVFRIGVHETEIDHLMYPDH